MKTHLFALAALALLPGCSRENATYFQGYIEGEYVLVASSVSGQMLDLAVERGTTVPQGTLLFTLDPEPEQAAVTEAQASLAAAQSNLLDLEKGKRPTEIASLNAQLDQARSAAEYSESELRRADALSKKDVVAKEQFDLARSTHEQNLKRIAQLQADLQTAALGSREDQIAASRNEVAARQAALDQALWRLSQKKQSAPRAGLVFDTLYRPGEWIAAGSPVISLLPPENIRARFFVPQSILSTLKPGQPVWLRIDGQSAPIAARIDYISPTAEYTPPVIFSRETRSKLVFRVEATFPDTTAALLRPGQPIEVYLEEP